MNMKDSKKSILLRIILILALAVMAYAGFALRGRQIANRDLSESRPAGKYNHIFDYARILADISSSTNRHLALIQEDYAIETLIVTLPSLPPAHTIESLAAEVFSNWQIGGTTDGRGLLLLLSDAEKLIKIEVSYELEDVFTDIFCGYIEDKQLKNYFLSDQVDIGLVAVLEEIENRSRIKYQQDYTSAQIDQLRCFRYGNHRSRAFCGRRNYLDCRRSSRERPDPYRRVVRAPC